MLNGNWYYDIAGVARDYIQARYPGLQVSVRQELIHAADLITVSVLTDITPRWEAHLSQAEVCLAGGTAAWMLPTIRREYAGVAIRLLEHAIYRVLLGLERLGRHKLRAQER
ncbi:MAG: hypothetical protein EI684_16460 [Candidatus Viridilinea halotolerans]|uniref:Uncharacterized protein n=1 Tax=Candidatus Viridilinea halotolerans TaxID=2491704 RepID=A0A426TUV0_9CHLR|nr:MAG: hypothetical protein EI684_16460 [Candidatus Viridilinea halotolerans]